MQGFSTFLTFDIKTKNNFTRTITRNTVDNVDSLSPRGGRKKNETLLRQSLLEARFEMVISRCEPLAHSNNFFENVGDRSRHSLESHQCVFIGRN